jgi:simple sugar transport system permease protein
MLDRLALERRASVPRVLAAASFAGSLAAGLLVSALVLVLAGVPASLLLEELVVQVFLTSDGLAQTVTTAIPLVLAGLCAAMAFRVGFWNIGIEGQLWLGAIAATAVSVHDLGPPGLRLALLLLASALAGALWIGIPLLLKLRLGVSEIVVSLLLANVAFLLLQHVLFGVLRDPGANFPVSPPFGPEEQLGRLGWGRTHMGLLLALAAALLAALLVHATRPGFYARVIGAGPAAARTAGLPVLATVAGFVLLSGGLAGLAGGVVVTGTEYRLTQFVGLNATFSGIVVATLARLDPLGVVVAAFLVAGLYVAGGTLKVFYGVSEGIVVLIQGILLLLLLVGQFVATFRVAVRAPVSA